MLKSIIGTVTKSDEKMKINVEYTAQLKAITGLPREHLHVDEKCSLLQLINILSDKHGERFKKFLITDNGTIIASILISINSEQVHTFNSINLKENDTVSFLAPMAGG